MLGATGNELYGSNSAAPVLGTQQGEGLAFYFVVLYLFFDLVRPSFVWHFPKMIAVILLIAWIMKAVKVTCAQMLYFVLFVAILSLDIVIAENRYDAVWTTYGMAFLLIGVCIPMVNFTNTLPKLRRVVNALLGIFLYVAGYAILHDGFGPAGTAGGQDENYVAAAMTLVIPLAVFSFFAEKTKWKKICFASLVCLYILAIVVGLSRGGFVGLLFALGFSFVKAPKKGLAISVAILVGALLVVVAGPSYWEEMSTITDTSEGTADLRLEFWAIAVREFLAYPVTGVGGGNFRWRMHEFQTPDQMVKFGRILVAETHSTYFQLLADMGLAGCIVFGLTLLRTYQDYRHVDGLSGKALGFSVEQKDDAFKEDVKWIQAYGRGLMGGLIGYMGSVAFVSALYYSHIWFVVSLMVALHMIATRRIGEDGKLLVLSEAKK